MEDSTNREKTPKLKPWMVAVFAIVVILIFFSFFFFFLLFSSSFSSFSSGVHAPEPTYAIPQNRKFFSFEE